MKILAIETSHDDTSIALYENKKIIYATTVSQTEFHKKFGGTVPEYASRGHYTNLYSSLEEFKKFNLNEIDYIALTVTPGLIGSLNMGKVFADALSITLNKEVINVNHMHGHIFAIEFNHSITYPAIALIVSGGHSQLWNVYNPNHVEIAGETTDDAAGEVFDKVARRLGLGFPGGPLIDRCFSEWGGDYIDFKIKDSEGPSFSFSGLKTKVINYISNNEKKESFNKIQVAASFQHWIVHYIIEKTKSFINVNPNVKSIIIGGGVSANDYLRSEFAKLHVNALIPEKKYTTDNAMMIAITADLQHNSKNGSEKNYQNDVIK